MTWGKVWWPIYLSVMAAIFIVPELYALFTNAANTLSEYCWKELHVSRALQFSMHTVAWYLSLIAWCLFVVIITLHIWYRSY